MYYLPILINNRKYVILSLKQETDRNTNESDYIVPVDVNGRPELIRLLPDLRATSENGTCEDITGLKISSYKYEGNDDGADSLLLVLEENAELNIEQKNNSPIIILQEESGIIIRLENKRREYKSLLIELRLNKVNNNGQSEQYNANLFFHIVPKDSVSEVSLDFGSEASQAAFLDESTFRRMSLINHARHINSSIEKGYNDTPISKFLQYDEEDNKLFKTIFYVESEYYRPLFLSKRIEDDELSTNGRFDLLPNIKIAILDEGEDRQNILSIYRKVILEFIETIIKAVFGEQIHQHIGIQLRLLVPNVMSVKTINALIQNIYDGLHLNCQLGKFVHVEITPVSESDASFAGYVEEKSITGNKTFLTIDAGKGTIDYSISRTDKFGHIESLYQNGFVGAGNALTYALFDHICTVIIGSVDSGRRRELMRQILMGNQTDQKGLRDLYNVLEKIKREYSNRDAAESNQGRCKELYNRTHNQVSELTAGGLAAILNEVGDGALGDQYTIIRKMCYDICSKLVRSLNGKIHFSNNWKPWKQHVINIDEVILTGRAFNFPLLQETLIKRFKEEWGENISIKLPPNPKSLCLRGALGRNLSVNFNCGLPSKPQIYKKKSLNNTYWDFTSDKAFELNENFINKGVHIDLNSAILFNGQEWTVRGISHRTTGELYFTGDQPILRHESSIDPLEPRVQEGENSMVFESKFPIYNRENDSNNITLFDLDNL